MKTTITKKIIALLGLIILFTQVSAQNDAGKKKECDTYMKRYKYMFEGKVISTRTGITIIKGEDIYANLTFYLVEVQKVLKGNIQKGTIEIMGNDGYIHKKGDDVGPIISSEPRDSVPHEGIYFSYRESDVKDSNAANTNSISLEFDGAIPLSKGELVKQPEGISKYFSTLAEFYDYLSVNYGVKIDSAK